jgi:hypothetical protein
MNTQSKDIKKLNAKNQKQAQTSKTANLKKGK